MIHVGATVVKNIRSVAVSINNEGDIMGDHDMFGQYPDDMNNWEKNIFKMAADILNKNKVVEYENKPNRNTVINNNDIMDLQITLNTCNDVNDFINKI